MRNNNDSDYVNAIEKHAKNLLSGNPELRNGACHAILLKLELDLISRETLLKDYHFIIGKSLTALNTPINENSLEFVVNIIKIFTIFAECNEGRELLKKYGTIEFLSQFLEYHKISKKSAVKEKIETLFLMMLNNGTPKLPMNKIPSSPKEIQTLPIVKKKKILTLQSIFCDLSISEDNADDLTTLKNLKLSDFDKSFLLELTTKLKYTKKDHLELDSPLIHSITILFENYPIEVFCSTFTELFYQLVRIILEMQSPIVRSFLYLKLLKKLAKELELRTVFSQNFFEQSKFECSSVELRNEYILDSYPPFKRSIINKSEYAPEKFSMWNIFEVVIRMFLIASFNNSFAGCLSKNLKALLNGLFQFAETRESQNNLSLVLLETLAFWKKNCLKEKSKPEEFISELPFLMRFWKQVYRISNFLIRRTKNQTSGNSLESLKKSFNFSIFIDWFVCGIFTPKQSIKILELFKTIDAKLAEIFLQMINLNQSLVLFAEIYPKYSKSMFTEKIQKAQLCCIFSECSKILNVVTIIESNISIFFRLFLIGMSLTRPDAIHKYCFVENEAELILTFTKNFWHAMLLILNSPKIHKTREFLFMDISILIAQDFKVALFDDQLISLRNELRKLIETTEFLTVLMLSFLESQLQTNVIIERSMLEILGHSLGAFSNLPENWDFFLLTNLIDLFSRKSSDAKSVLDLISMKFPIFSKINNLLNIFSKDILFSHNSFNSLVFDTSGDAILSNLENEKEMKLIGIHSGIRMSPSHHLAAFVNQETFEICYKSNLKILSKFTDQASFIETNRLQQLFDILDLFLNEQLESKIRYDSLNQCAEIMISLRENREARIFSSSIVSLSIERLMNEEISIFTDCYLKIINGFVLFQKYDTDLKIQVLQKARTHLLANNLIPVSKLLFSFNKSENQEYKFNILTFLQLVCFSSSFFEYQLKNNVNVQMHKNKRTPVVEVKCREKFKDKSKNQKIKVMFWKFNKPYFYNFIEERFFEFSSEILSSQLIPGQLIDLIQQNKCQFFDFKMNLESYIESSICGLRNHFSKSDSMADYLLLMEKICETIIFYFSYKDMNFDSPNNIELDGLLKEFLKNIVSKTKSYRETANSSHTFLEIMVCVIFGMGSGKSSLLAESFWNPFFDFSISLIQQKSIENQKIGFGLCTIYSEFCQIEFNQFITKTNIDVQPFINIFLNTNTKFLKILELPKFIRDIKTNEQASLDFRSACISNLEPNQGFYLGGANTLILKLLCQLEFNSNDLILAKVSDLYARVKEFLKSPCLEQRMFSWVQLYKLARYVNDPKFLQEIFYQCKMQITNEFDEEHPKINCLVLSVLTQVLVSKFADSKDCDFYFFNNSRIEKNYMSVLEFCSVLNLMNQLKASGRIVGPLKDNDFEKQLFDFILREKFEFCFVSEKKEFEENDFKAKRKFQFDLCNQIFISVIDNSSIIKYNMETDLIVPSFFIENKLIFFPTFKQTNLKTKNSEIYENFENNLQSRSFDNIRSYCLFIDQLVIFFVHSNFEFNATVNEKFMQILMFINQNVLISKIENHVIGSIISNLISLIKVETLGNQMIKTCIFLLCNFIENVESKLDHVSQKLFSFLGVLLFHFKKIDHSVDIDELKYKGKCVTQVLISKLLQLTYESNLNQFDFTNSSIFLSISNTAKLEILSKIFFGNIKNEVHKLISAKNSKALECFFNLLKALFLPLNSKIRISFFGPKSCESKQKISMPFTKIKENLSIIAIILVKGFMTDFNEDDKNIKFLILQILVNWHLNSDLSLFLQKQILKRNDTIFNSIIEFLKLENRMSSQQYLNYLNFLRSLSGNEFIVNQICKSKLLSSLSNKLVHIFNEVQSNHLSKSKINFTWPIIDFFFALSFKRQTHSKILENKAICEALIHFFNHVFKKFKTKQINDLKIDLEHQKKVHGLQFSEILRRYLILFTNLLLTKSSKAFILDSDSMIDSVFECIDYTTLTYDRLLLSQFIVNVIYKDGSAIKNFQNENYLGKLSILANETRVDLKQKSLEIQSKINSNRIQDYEQLQQLNKNLMSIQTILLF